MATRWRGMLAPINEPTGDGRRMAPGAFTSRPLPLPLKWQRTDENGHTTAVVVGSMDKLDIADDAVWGEGELFDDASPTATPRLAEDVAEAKLLLSKGVIGPSVDPGSAQAITVMKGSVEPLNDAMVERYWMQHGTMPETELLFTNYEIAAATLVPVPAFAACRPFELLDASGEPMPDAMRSIMAAAPLPTLDPALFRNPELSSITPLTMRDLGNGWTHVFGHVATHDVCHVGLRGVCTTAPYSDQEYQPFHRYSVTSGGHELPALAGRLTSGLGRFENKCRCHPGNDDHACGNVSFGAAIAHHDQMESLAYVCAGEDEPNNAIWFSGVLDPDASIQARNLLRRRMVSGDWREHGAGMELVEVLVLARREPGFPLPRVSVENGRQRSLTAAGVIMPREVGESDSFRNATTDGWDSATMESLNYDRLGAAVARSLMDAAGGSDDDLAFDKDQLRDRKGQWVRDPRSDGGAGAGGGSDSGSGGGAAPRRRGRGRASQQRTQEQYRRDRNRYNSEVIEKAHDAQGQADDSEEGHDSELDRLIDSASGAAGAGRDSAVDTLRQYLLDEYFFPTEMPTEPPRPSGVTAAARGDWSDLPLAPDGREWDKGAAVRRLVEWADDDISGKYARAFIWRDPDGDPDLQGTYKLPIADIIDGQLTIVPNAVRNAASRLEQTGGLGPDDEARVRSILDTLFGRIHEQAGDASMTAADAHTGAMVALRMTDADAERLAVDGGLEPDDMHMTLAYLGDAAGISEDARERITRSMVRIANKVGAPIEAEGFSVNAFNPGDANDRPTAIVMGVSGATLADMQQGVCKALGKCDGYEMPEQNEPWAAHATLKYDDDLSKVADYADRVGPITFDRLRLAFAGDVIDIPLGEIVEGDEVEQDARDSDGAMYARTARANQLAAQVWFASSEANRDRAQALAEQINATAIAVAG